MRRVDLELAFHAAGDEDRSVVVDRQADWTGGYRPREDAATPARFNPVNGTVLVVAHVQPPADGKLELYTLAS